MRKALFVGCSYTAGWRLPDEKLCPDLWCNQLFPDHEVCNHAWHGASNEGIFYEVCKQLRLVHYDKIVVAWTAIPRYAFHLGLELWDTNSNLIAQSVDVSGETVSAQYLKETGDRIRRYHNDHWDIVKLVEYTNVILELAQYHQQGSVYFVNALLPWCQDYFIKAPWSTPTDLDLYLQNMLQVECRDDQEVVALYKKIHHDYAAHGSINSLSWLNLYNSLDSIKIDTVSIDDSHPGVASQAVFVKKLRERLCEPQS